MASRPSATTSPPTTTPSTPPVLPTRRTRAAEIRAAEVAAAASPGATGAAAPRPVAARTRPRRADVVRAWALRLAWGAPFLVVVLLTQGADRLGAADLALVERGRLIDWGSTDLSWIAQTYPPFPAGVAAVLGGQPLALHLVAAAVAGLLLERLHATLRRVGLGAGPAVAVVLTLVLTPPVHYVVANDLQSLLGVALLVLALQQVARFVTADSTEAGIRAGVVLGIGVMVEPGAWLYALVLAALAPFLRPRGAADGPPRTVATVLVLLFPTAAAVSFWLYLAWWFTGDVPAALTAVVNVPSSGWTPGGAAVAVALGLLACPLLLHGALVRGVRRPRVLVAPAIAVAGLYLSLLLGLREAAGQTFVVLTSLYVLLLAPTGRRSTWVWVLAAAQVVLCWAAVLVADTPLSDWTHALLG